ncbi:zinc-dependent peptidase [Zunongwangia sp. HGR-M22]|uniref:M90 family metallopeptidase n=1 Tax=Zunongwangia sp. HGR-M22 TaxID=3015168 RepID=UPI0022DDEB40|nr:M90 family metallopeptidase [Zunongwangia sp. HGR-M22]WBL25187.1 zinc-dependent peptidase [Zunongwangia sp. HGR-M22]
MSKFFQAILVVLVLAAIVIYKITKKKKKKASPFPANWHQLLLDHVEFYAELTRVEKIRFQQRVMLFLNEVYIESVSFKLEDLDKILVACSAIIPVFRFRHWHYSNLSTVILYPNHFNKNLVFDNDGEDKIVMGLVGTGRFEHQMILSRRALHDGFAKHNDRLNTGIHEFVHLIDKMDGQTDGVPERLLKHTYTIPWLKMVHKEMEEINANKSDIRNYGGTNEAEFLATASEYFFENPKRMQRKHPDVYKMLHDCYFPED